MSLDTLLLVAVVFQTAVIVYLGIAQQRMNKVWTRAFLDKQGIPLHIMDDKPEPTVERKPEPPPKTKISIPVPGWRPGPVRHS